MGVFSCAYKCELVCFVSICLCDLCFVYKCSCVSGAFMCLCSCVYCVCVLMCVRFCIVYCAHCALVSVSLFVLVLCVRRWLICMFVFKYLCVFVCGMCGLCVLVCPLVVFVCPFVVCNFYLDVKHLYNRPFPQFPQPDLQHNGLET